MSKARGEAFFRWMAGIVAILTVSGFLLARIKFADQLPPLRPTVLAHGVTAVAWSVLLVIQTQWIGRGNFKAHMKSGIVGVFLAIALVVSGAIVMFERAARSLVAGERLDAISVFTAQSLDLILFTFIFAVALRMRKIPVAHKRLMLASAIYLTPPAIFRFVTVLDMTRLTVLPIFAAPLIALLIYDWRSLGRPHWASWMAFALAVVTMSLKFLLPEQGGWQEFIVRLVS